MSERDLRAIVTAELAWEPKVLGSGGGDRAAMRDVVWQAFILDSLIHRQREGPGR